MAVYAIGDVQGCYDELRRLLDRLDFDPGRDRLWLTGDLVNRGPGSLATLRFIRGLGDAAVTVLGNHDLHLLALAAQRKSTLRPGDTLAETLAAPDRDELLHWLVRRPLLHEDSTVDFVMIHAGLPPQWDLPLARSLAREVESVLVNAEPDFYSRMYGDEPAAWDPTLAGMDRLRFAINCFTRLRYCTAAGRLLMKLKGPPDTAPPHALAWFSVPGRRSLGTRIVFGHWSALGFRAADGVYSLDTGCVWGGSLTALRIDTALPAPPVCQPCAGSLAVGAD